MCRTRRRLGLVDDELAVPHVVAERRVAAHPKSSLAGGKELVSDSFASKLALKLGK